MSWKAHSRLLEWTLVAVAVGAAVPLVVASAARLQVRRTPVAAASLTAATVATHDGEQIGELRIPSVSLDVPVLEGCSDEALRGGACRMSETAQIGGLGTVAIAGHRDASFRSLAKVRPGDVIFASSKHESYRYVVDGTRIVLPQEVDVVATREQPTLVLITCFPFHYVGSAPKRFIVQAHLLLTQDSESDISTR